MRIPSPHACIIVFFILSLFTLCDKGMLKGVNIEEAGTRFWSWSPAMQCEHREEGVGLRFWGYKAGSLVEGRVAGSVGRLHGLISFFFFFGNHLLPGTAHSTRPVTGPHRSMEPVIDVR